MANKTGKKSERIEIVAHREEGSRRIYSNYVEVTASPIDVSLKFCDLKPPANQAELQEVQKNKKVKAPVISEIVLPIPVAISLIRALEAQLTKIKKQK